MKTILLIFFCSLSLSVFSQQSKIEISELGIFSNNESSDAKVYLEQDAKLKDIVLQKTKARKTVYKWRIRIYMGSGRNSRATATSTRNAFVARYPDIPAEIVYPSPYFKVYVGSFCTRIEAESFKRKILSEYPNSRSELVTISTGDK